MTRLELNLTAVQVRSVKDIPYGTPARMRLDSGDDVVLLRAAIPTSIPRNAVVSSAVVEYTQISESTGSRTNTLQRNASSFTAKTKWSKRPSGTGTTVPVTQTSTEGTLWSHTVTSDAQGFISRTLTNNGWRLTTSDTTARAYRGSTNSRLQPRLVIEYLVPGEAPTDLKPSGGAVSVAKPVLTFTADDDMTALQVQIDPAANGTTPAFDSGEVTASAGLLDLATTAYPGLADGASTQWRARVRTPLGLSPWSDWVDFSRDDFATPAITAPGATVADGTPPTEFSFPGQTAVEIIFTSGGKKLDGSGRMIGADTSWTPTKGLTKNGQVGTYEYRFEDGVDREATPGAPAYKSVFRTFTFELSDTVAPMDAVMASQDGVRPWVTLQGARAVGIPDEVAIFRDGAQIARVPGVDVFTGTSFEWVDYTARMNHPAEYRIAPIVNGETASGGPTVVWTPTCLGIWLVDLETGLAAALWGDEDASFGARDVAILHTPIGPEAEVSRRRLSRLPRSGSVGGTLVDVGDVLAEDSILALEAFAEADAGTIYHLVLADLTLPVIVGDVDPTPTALDGAERFYESAFSWWARR